MKNEFGVWIKGQFSNGHALGSVVDSRMYEAVGRYSRLISSNRSIALRYLAEIIPLSLVGSPQANGQRLYAYGAGAVPAAIQLNCLHYRQLQPFLETGGGFLYFNHQMFYGTQLNFTAEIGVGLQIFSSKHRGLDVGYEYHHMSNANLANNPGMDSHAIYMGVSFLR